MKLFKYRDFLNQLNESVINLSHELIESLYSIKDILDTDSQEWVEEIIYLSGKDIDTPKLRPENKYNFSLSDDPKYLNMQIVRSSGKKPKQKFKLGKSIKSIVPEIPNNILSKIVSALQSIDEDYKKIKIVQGEEIPKYYNYDNISKEGTLGNSCMNNVGNFFDLYSDNESVVKMAILIKNDELLARALIWITEDGESIMDRVYYSSDKYSYLLKKLAKENNYTLANELNYSCTVKLEYSEFDKYPYLDNFNYLCLNQKRLSNEDVFDGYDEVICLTDTDGGYEVIRNVKGELILIEDITQYVYAEELETFIKYSINNKKWFKDFISGEVEHIMSDDVKYFLEVYDYYIEEHFDELNFKDFDSEINKNNFKEKIKEFSETYLSKYEDVIINTIKHRYKDYNWEDYQEELGYSSLGSYYLLSNNEKRFYDRFIPEYCEVSIINEKIKKIWNSDSHDYQSLIFILGLR